MVSLLAVSMAPGSAALGALASAVSQPGASMVASGVAACVRARVDGLHGQNEFTGASLRASRAVLTGCSCHSICTSFCSLR